MALWLARNLCVAGLVPRRADGPWPEVPERLRGRAGVALADSELAAWRAEFERREASSLSARIEPAAVRGLNQIYSGVHGDGSLAPAAAFVLPGGRTLELCVRASDWGVAEVGRLRVLVAARFVRAETLP
jgi:hypothetical protein